MSLEIRKLIQAIGGGAGVQAQVIAMLDSVGGSLWVADPQYLALNSDGSGAVTDGGVVGYVRDLCAAARHMTQATTAAKPLINQVSGKWALQFDGVNDQLSTTTLAASTAETIISAGKFDLGTVNRTLISKRTTAEGMLIRKDNANVTRGFYGDGATIVNSTIKNPEDGEYGIYGVLSSVGSVKGRLNGAEAFSASRAYVSASASLLLGNDPVSSSPFSGLAPCVAYAPVALTDAQCLLIERYFGSLSGVTIP